MIVNEIFGSIDGEGIRTGELATFIRLAGCNLRCSYCDTLYALNVFLLNLTFFISEISCETKSVLFSIYLFLQDLFS